MESISMKNKIVFLILLFGNLTSAFELPKYPNPSSRDLNGMIKKFYLESKRVEGFYYTSKISLFESYLSLQKIWEKHFFNV